MIRCSSSSTFITEDTYQKMVNLDGQDILVRVMDTSDWISEEEEKVGSSQYIFLSYNND